MWSLVSHMASQINQFDETLGSLLMNVPGETLIFITLAGLKIKGPECKTAYQRAILEPRNSICLGCSVLLLVVGKWTFCTCEAV